MNDIPDLTYESPYRNSPFVVIGALAVLSAAAIAAWAVRAWFPVGGLLLPTVEIAVASLVSIVALSYAGSARHRWSVQGDVLRVVEISKMSWIWPPREFDVALSSVRGLRRVEVGFDVLLEVETGGGARHQIMQGHARDRVGTMLPDKAGLTAFGNGLRKRILAAGAAQTSFQDGLGFWNRGAGLGVLCALLIGTLGFSALLLYWIVAGTHVPQGSAMQGLAFVLLAPVGVAYALYRSFARRSFVLGLDALRDDLRAKG